VSTEHQITRRAADGPLTVADLREFLATIEQTAGNNNAVPKARIAFGGGIKSISVTIPGGGDRQ
jgi:hypothetical protein